MHRKGPDLLKMVCCPPFLPPIQWANRCSHLLSALPHDCHHGCMPCLSSYICVLCKRLRLTAAAELQGPQGRVSTAILRVRAAPRRALQPPRQHLQQLSMGIGICWAVLSCVAIMGTATKALSYLRHQGHSRPPCAPATGHCIPQAELAPEHLAQRGRAVSPAAGAEATRAARRGTAKATSSSGTDSGWK